jgi:hypothetical protein
MPLIPYPNIPKLPGVPALARSNNAQFAAGALNIVSQFLPDNLFGQQWAIITAGSSANQSTNSTGLLQTVANALTGGARQGSNIITPDSVVEFEYKEKNNVPIYPLQKGAFAAYNKIEIPYEISMTVTCSGNKSMKKADFIEKLDQLITTTTLVDIVTPDYVYLNNNLIGIDYRRESSRGATLLIAQLQFQWIRVLPTTTTSTAQPSGAALTPQGQTTPQSVGGSINVPSNTALA